MDTRKLGLTNFVEFFEAVYNVRFNPWDLVAVHHFYDPGLSYSENIKNMKPELAWVFKLFRALGGPT